MAGMFDDLIQKYAPPAGGGAPAAPAAATGPIGSPSYTDPNTGSQYKRVGDTYQLIGDGSGGGGPAAPAVSAPAPPAASPGVGPGMFDDLIQKYSQQAPTAAETANAPDYGALTASTNAMANALSFNFMDEAVAHAAAALDPVADWFRAKPVGGTYDERLARHEANQRLLDAAAEAQHPTASTVGGIGAVAAFAPKAIASGIVAPVMRAATTGERIVNAAIGSGKGAIGGAGYGFLSGYGAGQGGMVPRVQSGLAAVPSGAAAGALLGAPLGAISRVPVIPPNRVAAAAERANVAVPVALASDAHFVQQGGGAAKSVPYFGTRVTHAGERTVADFAAEKQRVAQGFGRGAAATPETAGGGAMDALANWVGPKTQRIVSNLYGKVDKLVNPNITTPLNETAKVATDIVRRNAASKLAPGSAVNFVRRALLDPNGLTYHATKDLRTRVRQMLDEPSRLPADMAKAELERIHGGLTKDLRIAAENAGGPAARRAHDRANLITAAIAKRRKELARVIGVNPDRPPSAETIFNIIRRKAGSKSTADIATINKLRRSMPKEAWDNVASGVIGELGRSDAQGVVSLDRFFTGYNELSAAGKQALFGNHPDLAAALDDLAIIAGRGKEVAKWANPSGTAQHGAYLAVLGTLLHPAAWPALVGGAIGAHFLTRALTRPATVRAMAGWARVWMQVNGRAGMAQSGSSKGSLQFVSRRLAAEIGTQFGLDRDRVNRIASDLQGGAAKAIH